MSGGPGVQSFQRREDSQIRIVGSTRGTFQQFINSAPDEEVLSFFRAADKQLSNGGLEHFHWKLQNVYDRRRRVPEGWHVLVYHNEEEGRSGPLKVDHCMSCDLTCPLAVGVLGYDAVPGGLTSADTLIHESEHTRCWLDAKARPMVVVTPKKHYERLEDLNDGELLDFWHTAVGVLDQLQLHDFVSMILNHGSYRNHAHLHLKVRVPYPLFSHAISSWDIELGDKLSRLRDFQRDLLPHQEQHHRDKRMRRSEGMGQMQDIQHGGSSNGTWRTDPVINKGERS